MRQAELTGTFRKFEDRRLQVPNHPYRVKFGSTGCKHQKLLANGNVRGFFLFTWSF